jgi:hypothetical protein
VLLSLLCKWTHDRPQDGVLPVLLILAADCGRKASNSNSRRAEKGQAGAGYPAKGRK